MATTTVRVMTTTTANENRNNVAKQCTPMEIRLFSSSTYTGLTSDAAAAAAAAAATAAATTTTATTATVVNNNDDDNALIGTIHALVVATSNNKK